MGIANLRHESDPMTVGPFEPEPSVGPTVIGPYHIVRELGRGGMGIVYEAVHAELGKRVALKLMQAEPRERAALAERFTREGRAACYIRHPNVIEVLELGNHAGLPYLVMTLLDGITLGELLQASHRLPLAAALDLLLPIVSAVSAAHAAGVVHRDLKPSNIMLAREREQLQPMLLDFGASKLDDPRAVPLTESGVLLGTLPYMAVEQVQGSKGADARSDQYSLAVILYECVTGRRPFDAESTYELMQAIVTAPVAAPSTLAADLPVALDVVLLRALDRDPRARFPNVAAFGAALLTLAPWDCHANYREEFGHALESAPAADLAIGATLRDTAKAPKTPVPAPRAAKSRAVSWAMIGVLAVLTLGSLFMLRNRSTIQPASPKLVTPAVQPTVIHANTPPALPLPAATLIAPAPPLEPVVAPTPAVRARKLRPRAVQIGENGAPILE